MKSMALYADLDALRASAADVRIVTSDGQTIAAHSYVLASASPVLEAMVDKARRGWGAAGCTVRIPGVSADAVLAFLHFLYASGVAPGEEEEVGAHGAQLLALAHAYRVGWLKRAAEAAVSARLTADRAVDMLKLARLCDAPRLYLRCARLAGKDFAAVERSDGYRFARRHDPALEHELLRLLEAADQRRARWERERASQEAYRRLGEAMDWLDHIFAEDDSGCGCRAASEDKPCAARDGACQGLRLLVRHFATCARKIAPGGCARCKRMLQLFRLHASVCDRPEQEQQPCRVPLCSHFKSKMQTEKADKTWWLLVKKVTRARAMASLGNRKEVPEVVAVSWARYNSSASSRYMQRGAEAVHAANPRVLVILSGLSFDNDLAFINSRPVNLSFAGKAAFEVHWYSFSNTQDWATGNANDVCARISASVSRRALYLLDKGWPVILSEFGVDNRGVNANDNRYWGCVAAVAADTDLDWALWTLQGSYYLREGVLDLDEVYGVLDQAWSKPRNETALRRVHALQRPFRGPGLAETAPYTVLFHPATGMCVVRRSMVQPLELGPCNETEAWTYTAQQQTLALRDSSHMCLRAEGAGKPARLGETCSDALARWRLMSDSKLHVGVNATGSDGMLCLDVGAEGQSVVTNPCRCLSADHSCDPGSQWFKLVTSTRSVANKNMLAQLPLKLKNWKIRSF